MKAKKAFTLIELLVVISIVAMLMAILLPMFQQVRKRAKAAGCQAKLRQWGIVFCIYMNEHNEIFADREGKFPGWWHCGRAYYGNVDALLLCPTATRYELNKNDPQWEGNAAIGWGMGSKSTAWKVTGCLGNTDTKTIFYGSYGVNTAMIETYSAHPTALHNLPRPARSAMPFLLDCVGAMVWGGPTSAPPPASSRLRWGSVSWRGFPLRPVHEMVLPRPSRRSDRQSVHGLVGAEDRSQRTMDPEMARRMEHLRPVDQGRRGPAGGLAGVDAQLQGLLRSLLRRGAAWARHIALVRSRKVGISIRPAFRMSSEFFTARWRIS